MENVILVIKGTAILGEGGERTVGTPSTQGLKPPMAEGPRWDRASAIQSLAALVGLAFTVAGPLFPQIASLPVWVRGLVLLVSLFLGALGALRKIVRTLQAWIHRILWYKRVYGAAQRAAVERDGFEQENQNLGAEIQGLRVDRDNLVEKLDRARMTTKGIRETLQALLPLMRDAHTADLITVVEGVGGEPLLVLEWHSWLRRGQVVVVVNRYTLDWKGRFEIMRVTPDGALARAIDADPIWLGYLASIAQPTLKGERAILIPNEDL